MPIFGTKKANNRRTLSHLLKIAHPLPEYKSLARIVGNKTADSALAMTYVIDSGLAQGDAKRLSDDMRVHQAFLDLCRVDTAVGSDLARSDPARSDN